MRHRPEAPPRRAVRPRCATPARVLVRRRTGLTVVELLLAAALGSLVLIGAAHTTGIFATSLGLLTDQRDVALEEALATIAHDVRYAWAVTAPSTRAIVVTDAEGGATTYAATAQGLTVTRPDGASGTLLADVDLVQFTPVTTRRLREDEPRQRAHTYWSSPEPATTAAVEIFEDGRELALGFTVSSHATWGTPAVSDVPEQVLEADLSTLHLPLATVLDAGADVELAVYRGWSPGDGRPEGAQLGSITLDQRALPVVTSYFWNPLTEQVVTFGLGRLWDLWQLFPHLDLVASPPLVDVPFDLSSMGITVRPGESYTIVVRVHGDGCIALRTHAAASADRSGVAFRESPTSPWVRQALAVPRSITGRVEQTTTRAEDVVARVLVTLGEGDELVSGSISLAGQLMVDDAWLGAATGEQPVLSGLLP